MNLEEWKEAAAKARTAQERTVVLDALAAYPGLSDKSRNRAWREVRDLAWDWDPRLLEHLALHCDGPPDSEGWLWLLTHEQSSEVILTRAGYLSSLHNGLYNHQARFAAKALEAYAASSEQGKAALIVAKFYAQERGGSKPKESVYREWLGRALESKGCTEVLLQLALEGWGGNFDELVESAHTLS